MIKMPLKAKILYFISQNTSVSYKDILNGLKEEYGNEGQFKSKLIIFHLQSMKAVGMIEKEKVYFDENNELEIKYKITNNGKNMLKYVKVIS